MLDVHVPEHKLSGMRDFLVHILTITVGLLIALGLENLAEAMHHRHQREEAEANIRQELKENRALLLQAQSTVVAERDGLQSLLTLLHDRSGGKPLPPGKALRLDFREQTIPDAAWRTASSTGVLAYMEYGRVEQFADAYKEQEMLQKAEEEALDDYLQLPPATATSLSPEEARSTLPLVLRALAHVNGMLAIGQGTMSAYDKALQ